MTNILHHWGLNTMYFTNVQFYHDDMCVHICMQSLELLCVYRFEEVSIYIFNCI